VTKCIWASQALEQVATHGTNEMGHSTAQHASCGRSGSRSSIVDRWNARVHRGLQALVRCLINYATLEYFDEGVNGVNGINSIDSININSTDMLPLIARRYS
jgi:hypothetical protein